MINEEFDISRFMYAFSHTSIRVKILKEVPEYSAGNETHGPFQEGATVDLPRWQAMALIEQDAAKPVNSLILDLSVLETVVLTEQQHQALQPLDPTFYMQLRTHMQLVRKRKRESPDPSSTFKRGNPKEPKKSAMTHCDFSTVAGGPCLAAPMARKIWLAMKLLEYLNISLEVSVRSLLER